MPLTLNLSIGLSIFWSSFRVFDAIFFTEQSELFGSELRTIVRLTRDWQSVSAED